MNAQQFSDKIFQFKGERKEAFNTANSQKKKKKKKPTIDKISLHNKIGFTLSRGKKSK